MPLSPLQTAAIRRAIDQVDAARRKDGKMQARHLPYSHKGEARGCRRTREGGDETTGLGDARSTVEDTGNSDGARPVVCVGSRRGTCVHPPKPW